MSMDGNSAEAEFLARLDARITALRTELAEKETARRVYVEMMGGSTPHAPSRAPTHTVREQRGSGYGAAPEGEGRAGVAVVHTLPNLSAAGLGTVEAAVIALRATGRPADSEDIARAMLAGGFRYTKPMQTLKRTLRGVLGRELRENPDTPLMRPGRGMFGLKEWGLPELPELPEAPLFDSEEDDDEGRQESEAAERE